MTPHNEAKIDDISNIVLMPGDPLRAKYIADTFLDDAKLVNTVRNMFGYTGFYKGKKITVFASGMGMPSIGIYSYELYKFYNVDTIIRIGSCGAYNENLNLLDTILVDNAYTEGNYAYELNEEDCHIMNSSSDINKVIEDTAKQHFSVLFGCLIEGLRKRLNLLFLKTHLDKVLGELFVGQAFGNLDMVLEPIDIDHRHG